MRCPRVAPTFICFPSCSLQAPPSRLGRCGQQRSASRKARRTTASPAPSPPTRAPTPCTTPNDDDALELAFLRDDLPLVHTPHIALHDMLAPTLDDCVDAPHITCTILHVLSDLDPHWKSKRRRFHANSEWRINAKASGNCRVLALRLSNPSVSKQEKQRLRDQRAALRNGLHVVNGKPLDIFR